MDPDDGLLVFVLVFLVAPIVLTALLLFIGLRLVMQKDRRLLRYMAIRHLGAKHGWTSSWENRSLAHRWTGEPFGVGVGRRAINSLSGRYHGYHFVTFDYQYVITTGATTHTVPCAVWVLKLPAMLPWLVVGQQGVLDVDDLQTESEEFNDAYHVRGADDRYAMAVIHPRMMDLLMSQRETYWRIDGDSLVYWEPGQIVPDRFVLRLNLLVRIASLIPSYVWKDYGRQA